MNEGATNDVQTSYDLLVDECVRHIYDELQHNHWIANSSIDLPPVLLV